jgi:CheY-like chemotaxis protein
VKLLGIAVKFTNQGGVRLKVAESPPGRLRFDIADTGVGMNADELEHIFDPFKQVEAGKAAGGTGLGLAITERLAEKLGSEVTVQTEFGRGSTFSIDIPLEETNAESFEALESEGALEYGEVTLAPGQEVAVLVADDRETNRDILDKMLTEAGFKVQLVDDGDTALEAMRVERPDMVLMDVRMPRMNGIEAVKAIRGEAALKDVKVIAVTASVFPEFREKAIREGFDDFLGKPFRTEELMAKLKEHLGLEYVAAEASRGKEAAGAEGAGGFGEVPAEMLEKLQAAIEIKNFSAIKRMGEELAADPETIATGDEILRLLRSFDFNGLAALAERN